MKTEKRLYNPQLLKFDSIHLMVQKYYGFVAIYRLLMRVYQGMRSCESRLINDNSIIKSIIFQFDFYQLNFEIEEFPRSKEQPSISYTFRLTEIISNLGQNNQRQFRIGRPWKFAVKMTTGRLSRNSKRPNVQNASCYRKIIQQIRTTNKCVVLFSHEWWVLP